MRATGAGEVALRRTARRIGIATASLCVLIALTGGFMTGWFAHDSVRAEQTREEHKATVVCILDVLIDRTEPADRLEGWGDDRLGTECGLSDGAVRRIRDEP